MAGVINNPEAIQKFRYELLELIDALCEQLRKTDASIEEVSKHWKDTMIRQFCSKFDEDKNVIEPLCKDIEDFENILQDLQRKLEKYLEQQY